MRLLFWSLLLPVMAAAQDYPVAVDFQNAPLGPYDEARVKTDWPGYDWGDLGPRANIVKDPADAKNQVLEVKYPAGKIGSEESGAQFLVRLPKTDEAELSYRVRFGPGFEWTRGGKLPGLTSRGTSFTGGKAKPDGTGWSARYMWRPKGKVVVYLYHMDMPGTYGDDVMLQDFTAEPEKWYRIKQRIRVNTGEKPDGILQVWVDGKLVVDRAGIRFRKEPKGPVDCFYFSTFYGGNSQDFAPEKDRVAWFDDFKIATP